GLVVEYPLERGVARTPGLRHPEGHHVCRERIPGQDRVTDQRLEQGLLESALESLTSEACEVLPLCVLVDRKHGAHLVLEALDRAGERLLGLGNGFAQPKAERWRPAPKLFLEARVVLTQP